MKVISINRNLENELIFDNEVCTQVGTVESDESIYPIVEWFNEPYVLIVDEVKRLSSFVAKSEIMSKQKFLVKYGMEEKFQLTI
ncbi:hypothetical protein [Mammaliicoccus vitulinus]|uniref:hypothetical protein n=1 Tax=Mammaliicoccus vitulinus TaxID=71237 RepID=UPI0028D29B2C|nr:hypothetical protein [Mammaliicoccus vitulinus]